MVWIDRQQRIKPTFFDISQRQLHVVSKFSMTVLSTAAATTNYYYTHQVINKYINSSIDCLSQSNLLFFCRNRDIERQQQQQQTNVHYFDRSLLHDISSSTVVTNKSGTNLLLQRTNIPSHQSIYIDSSVLSQSVKTVLFFGRKNERTETTN